MATVKALLCDETEAGSQGRQSRLFFPGGMGNLPNLLGLFTGLFQAITTTSTTAALATTTEAAVSTAATTTALEAKAQLLENNISSLRQAKAAVEKAIADARRRKRAVATTCAEFISLVKKRKIFYNS